jgi:hypothetical protein
LVNGAFFTLLADTAYVVIGVHADASALGVFQEEGWLAHRVAVLAGKILVFFAAVMAGGNVASLWACFAGVVVGQVSPVLACYDLASETSLNCPTGAGIEAGTVVDHVLLFAEAAGVVGHQDVGEGEVVEVAARISRANHEGSAVLP